MEQFLNNQQIPLVQVTDPSTGQQYYVPAATEYNDRNGPNPTILKSVVVDQAVSASYFSGSITNAVSSSYATTASYLDRPVTSASYAITASYANYAETASSALNAQDILIRVLNQSGNTIAKGIVVHITASGNSSDIPRVITASYESDSNSANTLGIANETIANGSEGYIMTEGVLKGINTQAFQSGQLIYLGATGSIIGYAPTAPLHSVRLGQVVREQSNNGSIYVRIDNGYELGELHDVRDTTTTSSYGDLLIKSGSVWTNSKQLTGSYSITGSLTISGSSTFINIGPAIFSGSITSTNGFTGSFQGTSSYSIYSANSDRAISSSFSANATSASFALTSSYVNTLNQNVLITGSLTVGSTTAGSSENTLTLGPAPGGGTGEGGQLGLQAAGGSYTSASMLDVWQDQFRILRGTNASSNAGLVYINLQSGNTQFVGAVTASAYSGLPNDYLYVTRNTSQTIGSGTWANRDIIFNNAVVSKGISYNTGTGIASLTGGKVYRITSRLAWNAAASYLFQFSCYDSSNNQLGPTVEIVQSTNSSNNISDATLDFIYAPGSNIDIKIRTTNNTNALTGEFIRGDLNTQLIIQQIA